MQATDRTPLLSSALSSPEPIAMDNLLVTGNSSGNSACVLTNRRTVQILNETDEIGRKKAEQQDAVTHSRDIFQPYIDKNRVKRIV